MSTELIIKYKDLSKLANFLSDLVSLNVGIIDKKVHSQALGKDVTLEVLSNYTAYGSSEFDGSQI